MTPAPSRITYHTSFAAIIRRMAIDLLAPDVAPAAASGDESDLIQRLRAGDKHACAECIDRHSAGVYRLALRMVSDPQEAEDIVQETFLSAFKAINSFEGRAGLGTWLYRIAYNTALMRLRKNSRSTCRSTPRRRPTKTTT